MSNIKYYTLPNKLNILFINDTSTDLAMCTVNIAVGSNMEVSKISGIAHLCEHILFHNKFNGHDITKEIHKISAHFNASTSYEQTSYYIITDKINMCTSIDLLYNIYIKNTFTDNDLDKEKRIVLEEYNLTTNNVPRILINNMFTTLFGKHISSNLLVIGEIDSIKSITKQNIIEYKKYYLPELTNLIFL